MEKITPNGEAKKTVIGKIVPTPRENNLASYSILDIIAKDGRSYISKKNNNTAAVTNTANWLKITDNTYDIAVRLGLFVGTETEFITSLSAASIEAARLATEQTRLCKTATEEAKTATSGAVSATQETTQAGQLATEQAAAASKIIIVVEDKAEALKEVIQAGKDQTASMRALEENITNYVQSAPTRMELSYLEVITINNPEKQRIDAKLFPAYVLQNVLFLSAGGEAVLSVDPDGLLHIHGVGKAKIHVIPTHNIKLYTTIEIEIKEPAMRLSGDGTIRISNNDEIRLT